MTPSSQRAPRSSAGLTLIEMMIVLAIMASVAGISVLAISSLDNAELKSTALKMGGKIRLVHGRAAINGRRYQIVFDLDAEEYWAECTDEEVALAQEEAREPAAGEDERFGDRGRPPEREDERDEEADFFGLQQNGRAFDDCSEDLFPRTKLPDGTELLRVLTTHQEEPHERGRATIAFFPNGFVERSMIWIGNDRGAVVTLTITPGTARVRTYMEDKEVPEDFFEVEEDD